MFLCKDKRKGMFTCIKEILFVNQGYYGEVRLAVLQLKLQESEFINKSVTLQRVVLPA